VLAALATGNMPERDALLASAEHERVERSALRSQKTRLVQLLTTDRVSASEGSSSVNVEALRKFHRQLGSDQHRVILVKRRK
jgi:hypothetical protein